jgi:hypothetical protein
MVQVLWGPAQLPAALADQLEGEMVAIGEAEVPDAFSFRRRVPGVVVYRRLGHGEFIAMDVVPLRNV